MKKYLLFALMVATVAASQVANGKMNAAPKDSTVNVSDEWTYKEVPCYNSNGVRWMYATVEVAIKRTSGGYIYKARMTGYDYRNDDWFPVTKGNYKCGDKVFKYRVYQWETYSYFNL